MLATGLDWSVAFWKKAIEDRTNLSILSIQPGLSEQSTQQAA